MPLRSDADRRALGGLQSVRGPWQACGGERLLGHLLDSIDEDLIAYPDEHEELPVEVARRMRDSAVALLDGDMHPSRLSSIGTTGIA